MNLVNQTQWWILPILGICLFTGCRTYGGSTDEQIAASLQAISLQIGAEASVLKIESQILAEAADRHSQLIPYRERMDALVSDYQEMMKKQNELIDDATSIQDNILTNWIGRDRYRGLHRALGAIVSEQETKQKKRSLLLIDIGTQLGVAQHRHAVEEGRLHIRPHHYNRSWAILDLRNLLATLDDSQS